MCVCVSLVSPPLRKRRKHPISADGENDGVPESAHMLNNTIISSTVKLAHTNMVILKTMHTCDVLDKHPRPNVWVCSKMGLG